MKISDWEAEELSKTLPAYRFLIANFYKYNCSTRPDLASVIARYLNVEHRDDVESGCVLPALAGEIRREPDLVRRAFTEELGHFITRLASRLPDDDADARTDHGLVLVAGMAGALLLARAVNDPVLSDHILRAAREYYTNAFAPQSETTSSST